MKKNIWAIVIILAIIGLGIWLVVSDKRIGGSSDTSTITNDFSKAPNSAELLSNLKSAGLDALTAEGTVLHIHQHLDIVVNDQPISVPADIGVGLDFISPIHTHDISGILHVESPVQKDFKLGQFFNEWGITLNDNCAGTYCADDTHKLIVAVNGAPIEHPHEYVLKAHDEIEIWYGDKKTNPTFIGSYTFPPGL